MLVDIWYAVVETLISRYTYVFADIFPVFPAPIEYTEEPFADVKVPEPHCTVSASTTEKVQVCVQPKLAISSVEGGIVPGVIEPPFIVSALVFTSVTEFPEAIAVLGGGAVLAATSLAPRTSAVCG